jgi:hypothetical protein
MKTQTSEMVPLGELVAHLGGSTEALDLWLKKFKVRPTSD